MRQTYVMVTALLFNTACQDRLRVHLIRCLKSKHMIPFPSRCRRTGKPHVETISVYCSCRLPESDDEKLRWLHVTSAVNGIVTTTSCKVRRSSTMRGTMKSFV